MPHEPVVFTPTPNPNAGKFTVGRPVLPSGSRTFASAADAADVPVAAALLALEGVSSIFMVSDFITVTKLASADWALLIPRITATIEGHFDAPAG